MAGGSAAVVATPALTPAGMRRYARGWRRAGWVVLLLALVVLPLHLGRQLTRAYASPEWPRAPGRVIVSDVSRDDDGSYSLHVWYSYDVGAHRYRGTRVSFGRHRAGLEQMTRTAARYPEGALVQPYYDPGDPAVSVLEAGVDRGGLWNMGAAFLAFELVFFGPAAWACFWASRHWARRAAGQPHA